MTHWRQLTVVFGNSDTINFGRFMDEASHGLRSIGGLVVDECDGHILEWPDVLVHADGEEPNWDTPQVEVDWTGLAEAVENASTDSRSVWKH